MNSNKCTLKFASGVEIEGTVWFAEYKTGWEWVFESDIQPMHRGRRIDATIPCHDACNDGFKTREAALADFKRFGEITETDNG